MIKDRNLKEKLLKYFLGRGWYPQLEVEVLVKQRVEKSVKVITDIDVLGVFPDVQGGFNYIIGDCKTLKGVSPISRVLWIKGLMEYFEASQGYIILTKRIEKEHQLTASILNVQLLSIDDFGTYSNHTLSYKMILESSLARIDNWDRLFEIENKYPKLKHVSLYTRVRFWNEPKSNIKLRNSLYELKSIRNELDPSNSLHLAFVLNFFSLIAIAINDIIVKIFNRYLIPTNKIELENDLKVIIWGGIDNYNYLNEFRKRATNSPLLENDLSLPAWDNFIEFVRTTLEAPLILNRVPLFIKESAFTFLDSNSNSEYLKTLSQESQYITSFSARLTDYLVKATGIHQEFYTTFQSTFLRIRQ